MVSRSQATQPKKKKKGLIFGGIILAIVLLLGIGGCAYVASIGKAWDNGTDKFDAAFPNEDGSEANQDQLRSQLSDQLKKEIGKDSYSSDIQNSEGRNNATEKDKNGNGIADDLEGGKTTERPAETGSSDILLMGSDSRAGTAEAATVTGQRADTLMLLHIPAGGGDPYLISIMRDTWVNIPGYGSAKINAGLNYGGVDVQIATIEQLLDIRIDHVAEIDFSGFKSMTDALGGVDVNVPLSFQADGKSYTAGQQHMNGDEALTFVRQRYAFEDGDYQRVRNQRAYMDGVLGTIKSQGAFKNATNFKNVVESIAPYVTVDSGLDSGAIVSMAAPYLSSGGPNLHMLTLPNAGTGWSVDGQSIVVLDSAATEDLSNALKNEDMAGYVSQYGED